MSNMIHNFSMRYECSSPTLDWQVGCCPVTKFDVYSGHIKLRTSTGIKKGGKP
jgi:hypothetical protein